MTPPRLRPGPLDRLGCLDLRAAVACCRQVARESFAATEAEFRRMEQALVTFDRALGAASRTDFGGHQYNDLREALAPLFAEKKDRIQQRFRDLVEAHELRRAQLDDFTVLFFGKTMAGKSTTIEAITAGSGATIGDGGPDYTKSITGVRCDGLLLVDTPGLLGFRPELAGVAESYVTRADLMCMVVSDDSIEPVLFEQMREIRGQHKRLAVLLNVKAANRRLLAMEADDAWDEREVGEYVDLIRAQLERAFPGDEIPILPYCANAAFEAQRTEDPQVRAFLWGHSRIDPVISLLAETVTRDGVAIRATAPFNALSWFAQSIAEDLEEDLHLLRRQVPELRRKQGEATRLFHRVVGDSAAELSQLKGHFQRVNDHLHGLAGELIRVERTESPAAAFRQACRWKEVQAQASHYQQGVIDRIRRAVGHFHDALQSDLVAVVELGANVAAFESPDLDAQTWKRQTARAVRVVGKPLAKWGSTVGGAAIGTSIGGPIGFVVGGILGFLGGWLAEAGADAIAEGLEASAERKLHRQHRDLREQMKDQLWTAYRGLNDRLYDWTRTTADRTGGAVAETLGALSDAVDALTGAMGTLVGALHRSRQAMTRASYDVLLRHQHPAFRSGKVELVDATQWMQYRAKLRVRCPDGRPPAGLVIGRGGEHLKALRKYTGMPIDVVADAGQPPTPQMVVEALRPGRISPSSVSIGRCVSVSADGQAAAAVMGRRRRNLLLAAELLGIEVILDRRPGREPA